VKKLIVKQLQFFVSIRGEKSFFQKWVKNQCAEFISNLKPTHINFNSDRPKKVETFLLASKLFFFSASNRWRFWAVFCQHVEECSAAEEELAAEQNRKKKPPQQQQDEGEHEGRVLAVRSLRVFLVLPGGVGSWKIRIEN
jgi:hypothetical protein